MIHFEFKFVKSLSDIVWGTNKWENGRIGYGPRGLGLTQHFKKTSEKPKLGNRKRTMSARERHKRESEGGIGSRADGVSMCGMRCSNDEAVRSILSWKYSTYEMR